MPSSPNYKRDYKQEGKTKRALKKKKLGKGATMEQARKADNKDRTNLNASRKKMGITGKGTHAGHKKASKNGGTTKASNMKRQSAKSNMSAGGKSGSSRGKAAGARKGHRSRRG